MKNQKLSTCALASDQMEPLKHRPYGAGNRFHDLSDKAVQRRLWRISGADGIVLGDHKQSGGEKQQQDQKKTEPENLLLRFFRHGGFLLKMIFHRCVCAADFGTQAAKDRPGTRRCGMAVL
ncbi:MAG TPA: hypothetical protein DF364_00680 [Ruminococcaceae bacterium]|nr:hypothetical protein [Oscillospiraceae bacterium]